jgi:DNA-binding response OmpR family regulator
VLVIEDDSTMRELVVRTLRGDGFEVLSAGSVAEGLSAAAERRFAIDLVLTDLGVPALGAAALPGLAAALAGAPPVLVMSGSAIDPELGGAAIAKPFSPDELLAAVTAALDRDDITRR